MIRKILFQSLILFCLSDCTGSKFAEPIAENYVLYLLLTTAGLPCSPQTYTNPWSFTDTNGDVKVRFFKYSRTGSRLSRSDFWKRAG